MKKAARKLHLNRETLTPMQKDELDHVNGGATPTITTSSQICISASSVIVSSLIETASQLFCKSRGCGK